MILWEENTTKYSNVAAFVSAKTHNSRPPLLEPMLSVAWTLCRRMMDMVVVK